jgi:RHH-type proline utilization regulon transcriptional repressor/proline dehydrogenase/delta 1-pyrroline-5-carboxylate dehydrogenase
MTELVPRVLDLAREAKDLDLGFTIDAEEVDRLELSLDVIGAVAADPSLAGWDGFGLAVQAYQKRAPAVIAWVTDLAEALGRRFMVRLVKGAYWDTEIKRAQERGLAGYPVYTRKAATDLCYLACARQMLAARLRLFPQFASHNALTVATILEMAGDDRTGFEFQRLHGMGEALYDAVWSMDRVPCRIYAPVGGHRELLAYLVRRLLENGANSSFVAIAGDRTVPVDSLLVRPATILEGGARARHARIPLPPDLYAPSRRNSRGMEFGCRRELDALVTGVAEHRSAVAAHPLAKIETGETAADVISPVDGRTIVGRVADAPASSVEAVMATAGEGFRGWSRAPASERATILERMADLL